MIKVIYFDFFKVISSPPLTFFMQKHVPVSRQTFFNEKLIPLDLGDLSEKEYVRLLAEETGASIETIEEEIRNIPKIDMRLIELIKTLKTRFKVGILSNAARNMLERILGEYINLFDIVVISSDCKLLKPHKEIFEFAIQKAGVEPDEILFTDDTEANIVGAKATGMNTILYTSFEQFSEDLKKYVD
ncbi:MAG TPA: HAD family phosphatase [Candidatus Paceibacterota bacterium]|nr:HAD family phosphatase [Candidatus Paceibacterota bacterium]